MAMALMSVCANVKSKPESVVAPSHGKLINEPALPGVYYETTVPDTLDLAERARLGINFFTGQIEESLNWEMPFVSLFTSPEGAKTINHVSVLGACQDKALEALCFERLMSGSRQNLDRETKMMEMMVSMLGGDGLHWVKEDAPKKPWMQISEPFAMVHGQGRMMRAMLAWYQYTDDPAWKERIDRMVDGLDKMVVHKDDYAYFPTGGFYDEEYLRSCYTPRGWRDATEPKNEKFGEEGSLFNHSGHIPGVLANWYMLTGNEKALRLSGELVRFFTKPQFWADWKNGDYPGVRGAEHAHWEGHFAGHVNVLRAILEYAIATNDSRLKQFVRDGYEWTRQIAFARAGYFALPHAQGCGCGRMIGLAAKLSDAGVGDYWEDVDQYVRNYGTGMQITEQDREYLNPSPEKTGPEWKKLEEIYEHSMGGFAIEPKKGYTVLCCATHGNMGLFYAWDGIIRYQEGTARINLLLNRASPWLDLDSYLPYEGKVVIKNKTAREVFVRIPLWVDRDKVRCRVGRRDLPSNSWLDNYLRLEGLKPNDVLTIQFPMVETTEVWTLPELNVKPGSGFHEHTCKFRGNTLVEISPPIAEGARAFDYSKRYLTANAPMKKVRRYVTPQVLRW